MRNRDAAAAALMLATALSVGAQTAPPEEAPKAAEAAKPAEGAKSTEATAAMERAKRQAAGPLRFILEASKGRRKAGEPDAGEAREAPVAAVRASSGSNSVGTRSVTTTSTAQPASLPVVAETPVAPPPLAPEASPIVTEITYNADLPNKTTAPVPALQTSGSASIALPARSVVAAMPLAPLVAAPVQPKLVSRVDPELTQRILDEMGTNRVVIVDLSLRANGSVSAVNPLGAVPRSLQRALVSALEQWRFEPLPSDVVHRVEVVFSSDR